MLNYAYTALTLTEILLKDHANDSKTIEWSGIMEKMKLIWKDDIKTNNILNEITNHIEEE